MRNPSSRVLQTFSLLIGALALVFGSAGLVGASQPERDGTIHQSLPIAADSFQQEGDCGPVGEGTAWHFILNNTTVDTSDSTLTATFENAGTVTAGVHEVTGGATHYFVATGDGDVLTAASVDTEDGQLQLSHVCDADAGTDEGDTDEGDDSDEGDDGDAGTEMIAICHALGNGEFNFIEVSVEGVLEGHAGDSHQEGDDIIPAFGDFPGQNTTATELTEADCDVEEAPTDPDDGDDSDENDEGDDDSDEGDDGSDEGDDGDDTEEGGETVEETDSDTDVEGDEVVRNPVTPATPAEPGVNPATPASPAQPAVESATDRDTQVLGAQTVRSLPRTGDENTYLAALGLGLVLLGFGFHVTSTRLRAARTS